jgi:pimeloyl-ACP methyl ester carboxylesterase
VIGAVCAALGLVAMPAASATPAATAAPAVPQLDWQPCEPGFFCATATVPMDYAHPAGATIQLAVIKHPATDSAHRIGSVFFNPGGPGGSGVHDLPVVFGEFPPSVRARFDVVSFDPRGIGQSAVLHCFDTNDQEQQLIGADAVTYPTNPAEQRGYEHDFAAFDAACAAHAGPLLAHDTTADVARDMDLLRQAVGDPTLNYLGTSYGTLLGATYANLFPTKVRAIALDGNYDPVALTTGAGGSANVLGSDLRAGVDQGSAATLDAFLTLCGQSTAGDCEFSAGTPAATHTKFTTLLDRLAAHPVTLGGQTYTEPFTIGAVINMLEMAEPVSGFPGDDGWHVPAQVLQSLWQQTSGAATGSLPNSSGGPDAAPYSGLESGDAVFCSDGPNPRGPGSYPAQADFAAARSGVVGPYWAWKAEVCAQWPVLSPDRYTGPWNTPTAHPILVVGNEFDPATPYRDAVAMAHDLADARLLTVNGFGHTAALNPSTCVNQIEDDYFVAGALPPAGTVCQQDKAPFAR